MARIEKLTPQQQAMLPGFRDHGLAVGLSTRPCDRPLAEQAMRAHYAALDRPEPRLIIWMDSPYQGVIAAALLSGAAISGNLVWAQVGAQVGAQVWDQVGAQVWDQVGDQVGDQVRDQVWDQVGDQVRDQVWDQVGAQVWDQVGDQVWDQVGAQVWDQVGAQIYRSGYGGMDMEWAAWARAHAAIGVDLPPSAHTLIAVSESCGWWWPFEQAVVICDRPREIHRDATGRLHSITGPAISYADGWAIHAVAGVRVPEWVIEQPESITPDAIKKERNAEIRRVMIRLYGLERYMNDVGAIVVDHAGDNDPRVGLRTGRLCRVSDEDGHWHFIDVLNSTPEPDGSIKRYQMIVNGDCYGGQASRSLLAAWASTFRDPRDPAKLAFARPEDALFTQES